jgi:hypothetical protein
MARMVRKQIYMDAELDRALSARAAARGVTQAEIVREALTRMLVGGADDARAASVARLEVMWAEAQAMGVGSLTGERTWTREELHERPGDARRERDRLRGRLEGPE